LALLSSFRETNRQMYTERSVVAEASRPRFPNFYRGSKKYQIWPQFSTLLAFASRVSKWSKMCEI